MLVIKLLSTPNHDVGGSDLWAIGWPWTTFTILATFGLAYKMLVATSQNYCVADSESFCVESWCEDDKTRVLLCTGQRSPVSWRPSAKFLQFGVAHFWTHIYSEREREAILHNRLSFCHTFLCARPHWLKPGTLWPLYCWRLFCEWQRWG